MRAKHAMAIILIAMSCFSITGCKKAEPTPEARAESDSTKNALPKAELPVPETVVAEETAEQEKIISQARALFGSRDFAALDKQAHELREKKRIFPNGTSALRRLYIGIEKIDKKAPDAQWTALIDALNEWIKQKPESITPRVALGETLVSYAWKARGTGYADTITEEGGKLMAERLAVAHKVLFEARNLGEKCPQLWLAAQDVALGEGWDANTYNALCDEGLSLFPENQTIYLYKAYELQPRWYGKPGEWEQFATASAAKVGGDEGEILYARIIWYLNAKGLFKNIFKDSTVKWERVRGSFEVLQKRYPDSLQVISEFARLSCNAGDWKKARELFTTIGFRVDSSVWTNKEHFVRYRSDAYAHQ